jgi:hypothetical protein
VSGLVGITRARQAMGGALLQQCALRNQRRPAGTAANTLITGRTGSGRSELARLYAQGLAELGLAPVGQHLRMSLVDDLAGQWPGQSASLVARAVQDAAGGVLVVNCDGDPGGDAREEAMAALVEQIRARPGDPVVALTGAVPVLNGLFAAVPALRECFGQRWDLAEYTVPELGEVAVRYLLNRGHEVPDDVRAAVRGLMSSLPEPTVLAAHRFSAGLARTAASRTLTAADLGAFAPAESLDLGLVGT